MTRLALAGFLVATVLAGCGSSSSSTESTTASAPSANATSSPPTTGSSTTSTAAPDTTALTTPGPPVPIGQTVLLSYSSVIGGDPDTQLDVTVHKVFPIQASGYVHLMAPDPLPYGVDITIKNHDSSTNTYEGGIDGDLELTSSSGQKRRPSLLHQTTARALTIRKTTT